MYKIVTTPDPVLSDVAKPIEKFDKKLQQIIKDMEVALKNTKDPIGVGLAAPQVGLSIRIFQMRPDEKSEIRTFINPEIISISDDDNTSAPQSKKVAKNKPKKEKKRLLEGCLSIPNIWGHVTRKKELELKYQDEKGETHTEKFSDFPAIIVQHEMDHLNGILFTKHVMDQDETLYKSHKNEQGEDEFEEIQI